MLGASARRAASSATERPGIGDRVTISIAGEELCLHSSGTLWWTSERTLIVSDLHFEKGSSFAKRGVFLPPYDTAVTLDRLAALVDQFDPVRVIALGDSFHDPDGAERMPIALQTQLAMLQIGREWIWIAGNHDPQASRGMFGHHVKAARIGALTFRHEPQPGLVMGEIAGHLHPLGRIRRHGRSVRRACFAGDGTRLILPAFGALTGGLNVLDEAWSEIFAGGDFKAYLLGDQRIYPIAAGKLRGD